MEVEYQGMKFKGGKFFIILSLIGTLAGGGWSIYKFIDDYLELKTAVANYVSPDFSHYDEQLAVQKAEIDTILDEVGLISEITRDIKNDLKLQIREMEESLNLMKADIRAIDKVVNDIEDRVKANEREISEDFKILEKEIDDKIKKSLSNPLAGIK